MAQQQQQTVKYVTDVASYEDLLGDEERVVCLYFTASWCGPCQRVAPDIDALANRLTRVTFAKIDVDEADMADVVTSSDVSSVPMFVFRKGQTIIESVIGANLPEITRIAELAEAAEVRAAETRAAMQAPEE